MFMKNLVLIMTVLILSSISVSAQDIDKILAERLKAEPLGSAFSVAVVNEKGAKFYNVGKTSKQANALIANENTVYELGSVTKVFVGILLAEAVKRGEVKLDDPISKHLPKDVVTPKFNGKEITLLDLTTHHSSLPRLPENFAPADNTNPYADYTVKHMYEFLGQVKLSKEIGSEYAYSNFGVGLLGHILSLEAALPFEILVKTRILDPLGMKNTTIVLSPKMKVHLAIGHDADGKPTSNWDLAALAGAGALRSTAGDMAKFISANLGILKTPISDSLAEAQKMRRTGERPTQKIGLGWLADPLLNRQLIFHGGGTGGYVTLVALDKERKTGAFIATNSPSKSDDIGVHILENTYPLRKIKQSISFSAEILEKYVGEYQLAPTFSIVITREGEQLFGQATNQPKFEMFGEKENEFFLKVVEASIIFNKDEAGKVVGLVLKQGGKDNPGRKIK
jgi:D-alanyl-D-alanine-carboxypeptidase/D-alanyl-D-alanine-endopeptidase